MKISNYYKKLGYEVSLKLDYRNLEDFSKVFIGKVFTDNVVPREVLKFSNVEYGGTGFFYDKAPNLPNIIEHALPDYDLYSKCKDFSNASIGFLTRGCFRKCSFCVHRRYERSFQASDLNEFLDKDKKYITFLDDNFLAFPKWKEILMKVKATGKPFQFIQGLDIRLLNEEKAKEFASAKYHGDYIFAFDDIKDKELIETKLRLWRKYSKKSTKLYLFCAYDKANNYDEVFWANDIRDLFERIKVLMEYDCLGYVMRYTLYKDSPYEKLYINIARWVNQPSFYKKMSYRDFCSKNQSRMKSDRACSALKSLREFESKYPEHSYLFDLEYNQMKMTK